MALIFPRLARNFVKNGYFPTDSVTLGRINAGLSLAGDHANIFDPCCGEGAALAEVKQSLVRQSDDCTVTAFGVEYDKERAWHSKRVLDHCIHGDIRDCMISARQFGLLFLNPPYGDAVADKAQLSASTKGKLRLEKEFYRRTHGLLQFGGVMALIVPYYVLDSEFSNWISTHFHDVKVYMAPEQAFKQAVVFGVKHRVSNTWSSMPEFKATRDRLALLGLGNTSLIGELPDYWEEADTYAVPDVIDSGRFELVHLDGLQLADQLKNRSGLWRQYDQLFGTAKSIQHKRPLCDVSDWHLALLLAAGQVSGVVNSHDGRTFVVRGDTYKDKKVTTTNELDGKGKSTTVRTHTDIFVPAIRGLDMTPGSITFGDVFTIK